MYILPVDDLGRGQVSDSGGTTPQSGTKMSSRIQSAAAVILVFAVSGCIDSRCYSDLDCPGSKLCDLSGRTCYTPECAETDPESCGSGRYCERGLCREGCTTTAECGEDRKCVENRCQLLPSDCECISPPTFCSRDLHPDSPTFNQQVCMAEPAGDARLLFFGNVG